MKNYTNIGRRSVRTLAHAMWHVLFAALVVIGFTQGAHATVTDNVVVQWNQAVLQAIRITHPGPPIVARQLAMTHTAIFDAWVAYDLHAVGTRLGGSLRRPPAEMTQANKNKAVSYAAYRALADLFPSQIGSFSALMWRLGYDPSDASNDVTTPAGVGNVAAAALLAYRHNDGSNQLNAYADYTGYQPRNTHDAIVDPNHWQPLRVANGRGGFAVQKFIAPHWGNVTPFALTSPTQFRPLPPAYFGSQEFVAQAMRVLRYSKNLDDREKVIAEYWADGPESELPPGHWCLFAQYVAARDHHGIDDSVRMFFAMTNAVLDASIVSWEAKRYYDYVRPVTAIHYLFKDKPVKAWAGPYQGTRWILGQDWQPYQAKTVVTPPFAEYISGHSIFSRAAATVLRKFTGSDAFGMSVTIPQGSSRVEPGMVPARDVTLSWPTFTSAANEAGKSRRYGGIHFVDGDVEARKLGKLVGKQAWRKALSYIDPGKNEVFDAMDAATEVND